jgi:hypothetical protein
MVFGGDEFHQGQGHAGGVGDIERLVSAVQHRGGHQNLDAGPVVLIGTAGGRRWRGLAGGHETAPV